MNNININIRLRPIRFAFLVRPNNEKKIDYIFRINTCLWGGMYNPIIPFFKRLPNWWERGSHKFESAKQVLNGYLDFFEPDFIVEAENGLANELGFDSNRILNFSDLLPRNNDDDRKRVGLSVIDLYKDLYKKEFQFKRRHVPNFVHITERNKKFKSFVSCFFGSYPDQEDLSYFENAYKDIFTPTLKTIDSEAILELYKSDYISPLAIGQTKINVNYHHSNEPTLFILDAYKSRDLIDFWNLRAIQKNIVAIPVQWLSELAPFCKDFIKKNYRTIPGNPYGTKFQPKSLFSRSIPDEEIDKIHKEHLQVDEEGANAIQTWYPPIWRQTPDMMVRTTRPTLTAGEEKIDTQVNPDNPKIRFDPLHPEFAKKYGGKYRWTNSINLRDWSREDQIATVFPCDYRNPSFPKFRFSLGPNIVPTTEGLVFFPEHKNLSERWNLLNGTTALNKWFKSKNITAELSDAGRTTEQIIQTLGGTIGVGSIAHKGIIGILDEMSRRPVKHSMHYAKFRNKINDAVGNDDWRYNDFETLVEKKAVQLGLELRCSKCQSWNWYPVDQLDYKLVCNLCHKTYDFPIKNPGSSHNSRWAYRVVGPFALPDFARGGYSAALAIRFFADVVGDRDVSEITWSAGQEIEINSKDKSEADFILWYQRKEFFGPDYPTEVIFGEAKSFGRDVFKKEDVDKMRLLANKFPGAIIVFATMKDANDLSKDEIKRLKKLAEWGREYDKERQQIRAPVIILTSVELFSARSLDLSWQEKSNKHKQFAKTARIRPNNLEVLADLTQQLYLDMPSYHEWLEGKRGKRSKQKK